MSFEPIKQMPLDTGASKMLTMQSLLTTDIAWIFYANISVLAAQAALYGGCMVMFNVWLMNRRLQMAAKIAKVAPNEEIRVFYAAAVQRFIFTLGFFLLGMGWFELPPLPMIIAFSINHLGYLFNGQNLTTIPSYKAQSEKGK